MRLAELISNFRRRGGWFPIVERDEIHAYLNLFT